MAVSCSEIFKVFKIFLQVVIVGNGGVGKSSMIQRYCRGTFTKSYKKTIGIKMYRNNFISLYS